MQPTPKNALRAAIMAALAGGAQTAMAVVDLSNPTPVAFAKELPTTETALTNASNALSVDAPVTSFTPTTGQSLFITVNLTNGATFGDTPSVTCETSAGTTDSATLTLGGNDSAQAVFTLPSATTTATVTGSCTVSALTYNVSGGHSDVNMSVHYQYGTLSSSQVSGTFITYKKGVSAAIPTAGALVAQVTAGFTTIGNASGTTTASLGTVQYASNGLAFIADGATTAAATDVLSTASITVQGGILQAAKTTGGVYIVSAGDNCVGGTVLASVTGGVNSVTFNNITPAQISAGVRVCVTVDGTTPIPAGNVTVSVSGTPNAGWLPDFSLTNNTLATITRNGASAVAYNVPNPNAPDKAFIRVYNTSGQAGALRVTLYDQAGNVIGAANSTLVASMAANEVKVFTVQDLLTAVGAPTPAPGGRYRAVFTGEVPSGRLHVQNLVRQASGGPLTNLSATGAENN